MRWAAMCRRLARGWIEMSADDMVTGCSVIALIQLSG